jgi:hypothetical protein
VCSGAGAERCREMQRDAERCREVQRCSGAVVQWCILGAGAGAEVQQCSSGWLNVYSLPRSSFSDTTCIKLFDIIMVFAFALVYDTLGKY